MRGRRTLRDRMLEVQESSRVDQGGPAGAEHAKDSTASSRMAARFDGIAEAKEKFAALPAAEQRRLLQGIQQANDEAEHIRTYRRRD